MKIQKSNKFDIVNGFDFGSLPIKVDFVGLVKDKTWPHYLWTVTITSKTGFHVTQYKTGIGLVLKGKTHFGDAIPMKPENAEIMHSLLMDSQAIDTSFNYWCADFGYSEDSISAFKIYQTCCELAIMLKKCFSNECLTAMREALIDF